MTAIPETFRAYVAERLDDRLERGVCEFHEPDLPPGEVEIRVEWSSVNFKDGLATRFDGKVARLSPLIPGIDLAGVVVAAEDASLPVGSPDSSASPRRNAAARSVRRPPAFVEVRSAFDATRGFPDASSTTIASASSAAAIPTPRCPRRGRTAAPSAAPAASTSASGSSGAISSLSPKRPAVGELEQQVIQHGDSGGDAVLALRVRA